MNGTIGKKLIVVGFFLFSLALSPSEAAKSLYKGDVRKGEIQILKEDLVFGNKWYQFYNDKVKFPNGKEGTYIRLVPSQFSPQGFSGVAILAVTKDDKIILEKIFRHAPRKWLWEAPRGHWEAGESLLQTAKRELSEETGFRCETWKDLGIMMPYSGITSDHGKLFLAKDCIKTAEASDPEETKRIHLRLFSLDEVMKMAEESEIEDGITLSLLLKAQKFLK